MFWYIEQDSPPPLFMRGRLQGFLVCAEWAQQNFEMTQFYQIANISSQSFAYVMPVSCEQMRDTRHT